jgi:hypothetical protein
VLRGGIDLPVSLGLSPFEVLELDGLRPPYAKMSVSN